MEIFTVLRDTPLPTILVVVGSIFLLLAVVSQISTYVTVSPKQQKWAAAIGALLLALGVSLYLVPPQQKSSQVSLQSPPPQVPASPAAAQSSTSSALPLNTQLTVAAWDRYNEENYKQAIDSAQKCIDEFEDQAVRENSALTSIGERTPPVGSVSDSEYKKIILRGVINDVATCYFIKAESLNKLKQYSEAKEAYKKVLQFPYARVWDQAGKSFWSPADKASDRLAKLP
jgi:tetratricopeptide (TPR) repeat protein